MQKYNVLYYKTYYLDIYKITYLPINNKYKYINYLYQCKIVLSYSKIFLSFYVG